MLIMNLLKGQLTDSQDLAAPDPAGLAAPASHTQHQGPLLHTAKSTGNAEHPPMCMLLKCATLSRRLSAWQQQNPALSVCPPWPAAAAVVLAVVICLP